MWDECEAARRQAVRGQANQNSDRCALWQIQSDLASPQARGSSDGARPSAPAPRAPGFTAGAYFIGKALWGKGYTELLALLAAHKAATGVALRVDAYGAGEDAEDIGAKARTAAVLFPLLRGATSIFSFADGMKLCS